MGLKAGRSIRHVGANLADVVLVCRKCSKKLRGGFGPDGDERLARALRHRQATHRKLRRTSVAILEVGCLDLCPKDGVAVLHGGRPGDWLVVPRGTPMEEVERHLGLRRAEAGA